MKHTQKILNRFETAAMLFKLHSDANMSDVDPWPDATAKEKQNYRQEWQTPDMSSKMCRHLEKSLQMVLGEDFFYHVVENCWGDFQPPVLSVELIEKHYNKFMEGK